MLSKKSKKIKKQKVKWRLLKNNIEIEFLEEDDVKKFFKDYVEITSFYYINKNVCKLMKYDACKFYYPTRYDWTHNSTKCFITNKYFETLKPINPDYIHIISNFKKLCIQIGDTVYTDDEGMNFIKEINTDHTPLVMKGSDWPYWFKVDGVLKKSRTSNFYNWLYREFGFLSVNFLEEYKGEDKHLEHLKDKL